MSGARLHDSEWLPLAERLPVGQQQRVMHDCGRTPSLIIRRSVGKLTAHCFRCKGWGSKILEMRVHPSLREPEAVKQFKLPHEYGMPTGYHRLRMYQFLASKGIDAKMVPDGTLYSFQHNRVAFRVNEGLVVARTMADAVPKWVQYQDPVYGLGYGVRIGIGTGVTVLTEDWLSALKVGYSTGHKVIALLGTSITREVESLLLADNQPVLIMLDADRAGRAGALAALKQLRFLGIICRIVYLPDGKDPKDLQVQELRELLEWKHAEV